MYNKPKIHFIGGGAWGQALAKTLANSNFDISILISDRLRIRKIKKSINVNAYVEPEKLESAEIVFITTQSFRVEKSIDKTISYNPNAKIILTSKGFANEKGETFPQILKKKYPKITFGILTGPTFASEISKKLPSAGVIASESLEFSKSISQIFYSTCLRLYPSNDVIGASVAGAIKNIMAIGSGISDGLKLGENAKSALITRGISELSQIITSVGGQKETAFGLAGMGDMILTCGSAKSRNMKYGLELIQKKRIGSKKLVEGLYALKGAKSLSLKYKLDTPIINAIDDFINNGLKINDIILKLLRRPIKMEF